MKTAAQYMRMSTDVQDLSLDIQRAAIAGYAHAHGMTVTATYEDEGRSGLTLNNRSGMKRLLRDVAEDRCGFSVVLVYDVSRWGRFQDTDVSAYYEYHCRLNGVEVIYVAESFAADRSPMSALIKNLKRTMAAEFSRELAVKTKAGQAAALDRGFHMGTLPCIGIGRVAVLGHDLSERKLTANEHKAAHREHVKWVPGPESEVRLVRHIFHLYTTTEISILGLSRVLEREGATARDGLRLTPWKLYSLLASEAFVGTFVWGRESRGKKRSEGDADFRRIPAAIKPIISRQVWDAAKAKRAKRAGTLRSRETLLDDLRRLVTLTPGLNASQLQFHNCATRSTYVKYFGSFEAALGLIGLLPSKRDKETYQRVTETRALGWRFCNSVAFVLERLGVQCRRLGADRGGQSVLVNEGIRVRVQVIWRRMKFGTMQWSLRKVYREVFDYVFVVRLNADNSVFDSMLLRKDEYFSHKLWFSDALVGAYVRLESEADVELKFRSLRKLNFLTGAA